MNTWTVPCLEIPYITNVQWAALKARIIEGDESTAVTEFYRIFRIKNFNKGYLSEGFVSLFRLKHYLANVFNSGGS
jgi:hypothetical protein